MTAEVMETPRLDQHTLQLWFSRPICLGSYPATIDFLRQSISETSIPTSLPGLLFLDCL